MFPGMVSDLGEAVMGVHAATASATNHDRIPRRIQTQLTGRVRVPFERRPTMIGTATTWSAPGPIWLRVSNDPPRTMATVLLQRSIIQTALPAWA